VTAECRFLDRPVAGSVTRSITGASPGPCGANYWRYAAAQTAPREAREHTRNFLGHCQDNTSDTVFTAELLVSELVANACTASPAASSISLSLRHFYRHLLFEVTDSSPDPPVLTDPGIESQHGRGLVLVNEFSSQWGYFYLRNGRKTVYAILPVLVP
jgi:hypothetical protein